MKQVVNVSISGISFKIEEDAYSLLENYLSELEGFYGKESDGAEIVADIEERIAELFIERGGKVRTIPVDVVREVVALLGHPQEMENLSGREGETYKDKTKSFKKLYRDIQDKVFGGVCSGLGAYFGADAVMIRLIFVLLAFATSIFQIGGSSFGFMILVYLLLWMIIPAARTVEQRCAMRGRSAGIDDMPKGGGGSVNMGSKKGDGYNGRRGRGKCADGINVIFNIILVCIGIGLMALGFAGLIAGMALVLGIEIAEGLSLFSLVDYVSLGVDNTLWLKLLIPLAYFIPFVGMLYGGVMLCFKFKAPKWHPGLIMFLLWIAAIFGLFSVGVKSATPYMDHSTWSEDRPIALGIDTLYLNVVPFDGIDGSIALKDKDRDDFRADYIIEKGKDKEFVKYPDVRIVKHTPQEGEEPYKPFVELKSKVYEGVGSYNINRPTAMESICTVKDSVVEIHPKFYSKENKFNGEELAIWVHVPATMSVILTDEKGKVSYYDE